MHYFPLFADDQIGLIISFRFNVRITYIFISIKPYRKMIDKFLRYFSRTHTTAGCPLQVKIPVELPGQ